MTAPSRESRVGGTREKNRHLHGWCKSNRDFMPLNSIKLDDKLNMQEILSQYPSCFEGIGKLKQYEVNLRVEPTSKPVAEPPVEFLIN